MLPGHGGHFHGGDSWGVERLGYSFYALGAGLDVDHHALEGVKLVNRCEGLAIAWFMGQVSLCVWSSDDG